MILLTFLKLTRKAYLVGHPCTTPEAAADDAKQLAYAGQAAGLVQAHGCRLLAAC